MPAAAIVGGSIISGAMGADAAKSGARAQQQAAEMSTAEQRRQFDLTRADNKPWMDAGTAGVNRLQYLLGLDAAVGSPYAAGNMLTRDDIRNELLPTYTSSVRKAVSTPNNAYLYGDVDRNRPTGQRYKSESVIDEAGLNAAIAKRMAEQEAQRAAQIKSAQADPEFGSLLKQYDANAFWNDDATQLGLEYGLNEGTKGINRLAAATGGVQNGKTLKALTRFGQDYMGTKFNEGFNRDQVNKNSIYNKLAGISSAGQQSTQFVGSAGTKMANNVSQNLIGAGNARAASSIAQGNAWSGAIGGAINGWKQNQLLNSLGGGGGWYDNVYSKL